MVILSDFLEYKAYFTNPFFFTVITAGLTKQFSSMLFAFSILPVSLACLFLFYPIVVDGSVSVFLLAVSISRPLSVVFLLPVPSRRGFRGF